MKIKNYYWLLKQKIKIFFKSNEFKIKINYFKASILSIIIGIIISFIVILANSSNPLLFFSYVFRLAFHPLLKDQTLTYWSIYIIAGLSMLVSFKAGLFNIGVPGQMLLAGSMTIVFGLKNPNINQSTAIIFSLIISIFIGALLASIAGVLKSFFNIHEVVSTIMLNWIVWYVMKWMFMNPNNKMWNSNQNSTIDILLVSPNFNLILNKQTWIIPFIIAILLLIIIIFIMNYTVLGFRIKMIGKSKNASLYSGINIKAYTIISLSLSGGLAGILGMLYYITQSTVLQFTTDSLPIVGFDSISVSLVAFNNGFAILPIALLWGIIKTSALQATQLSDFQMSKQMGQLIFGIIIYITSISTLFIYFRPIFWIRNWWNFHNNLKWKNKFNQYKKQIKNINKLYKIKVKKLKKLGKKEEIKIYYNNISNKLNFYYLKINNLKKEIYFFENLEYKKTIKTKENNIKKKYKLLLFENIYKTLDTFIKIKNDFFLNKQKIIFLKNNYNQLVLKTKEQCKQKIFELYNLPKKELLDKILYLKTKYYLLVLKQYKDIKKIRENYFFIFNEIKKKYFNDLKVLQKKEILISKKMNKDIRKIKLQQFLEIYKFKILNYKSILKIKYQLKIINFKIKKNINIQKRIIILKQNLEKQLKKIKKQFKFKYKNMNKKYKKNFLYLKSELNKKINNIINIFLENKKKIKEKYIIEKKLYQIQKKEKK